MTLRQKILLLGIAATAGMFLALWCQYTNYMAQLRSVESISGSINQINTLSHAVHELQKERGLTTITLSASAADADGMVMLEQYASTDALVAELAGMGGKAAALRRNIAEIRGLVRRGKIAPIQARDRYTLLIRDVTDDMSRLTRQPGPDVVNDDISAHVYLVAAKEYLGQMRATVGYVIGNGNHDVLARQNLARLKGLFDEDVRKFMLNISAQSKDRLAAYFSSSAVESALSIVSRLADSGNGAPDMGAGEWWALATSAVDQLKAAEDQSLYFVDAKASARLGEIRRSLMFDVIAILAIALIVAALTVSTIVGLFRALDRLLAGMEQITDTQDFSLRLPAGGHDEIGRISRSFNQLLDIADRLLTEKEYLATRDSLTGIHNRRSFMQELHGEVLRKQRLGTSMSLIMFDIDNFKKVNDTHGHEAGDMVLKSVVKLVADSIRSIDLFCRWGGEEFAILLKDSDLDAAAALAEKLCAQLGAWELPQVGRVTCSFGVGTWHKEDTETGFMKRADEALYLSKKEGRNRVSNEKQLPTGR